jgi:two-component system, OmpR family, phosphate regulon response regulator PhoB
MKRQAPRLRNEETLILVVEDEQPIRDLIAFGLRRAGFQVSLAQDCQSARASIVDHRPALVLVDWMLPDTSGLELTRQLRKDPSTQDIPVIMLTARADESDKIAGLEGGADDYITKPFSARELVARIQALLRRMAPGGADGRIDIGGLSLDQAGHRVTAGGRAVSLGPTEYRLLSFLMAHADRVYSRSQLLDRVWGGNVYVEERTVDVHIRRVRKALEASGCNRFVQTVRGAGYRFSAQDD